MQTRTDSERSSALRTYLSFIALLLALAPSTARGQIANGIGVTVEFAPDAEVESVASQDGEVEPDNPPELGYQNVRATLLLPVELDSIDAVLIPGFSYRLYRPQVDDRIVFQGPDNLHDVNLQLGVLKHFNDTWSFLLIGSAGLATDFEDLEADHLRFQGIAALRYDNGASWTFGVGAAFTYWFGEPLALPVLQAVYTGERWNADVNLPQLASIRYTVVDDFDIGFLGQLDGNRFSIGEDLPVESVRLTIADAGLQAGVRVSGPVWFTVYGGVTLLRQYEYQTDDNATLLNLDQVPGPIFRLGLLLRPKRD
ncbi:MAG: DUF6268 family outer membrane beta-barrel protein [Myxococcota bacterium]